MPQPAICRELCRGLPVRLHRAGRGSRDLRASAISASMAAGEEICRWLACAFDGAQWVKYTLPPTCGVYMMLPGTILPPGMGVLFFLGYTSVIFCFGRNFSRPTVYCSFFKVGRLLPSLSSYCQPLPLRAAFICVTAFCQSPSVTIVVPPVLPLPVPCS